MNLVKCHERDELEKRLSDSLKGLSTSSRTAAQIARGEGGAMSQFDDARSKHAVLMERVKTLRECLHLHKDVHGC